MRAVQGSFGSLKTSCQRFKQLKPAKVGMPAQLHRMKLKKADDQTSQARKLNRTKSQIRLVRRLDEFDHKTEHQVKKHEQPEQLAARVGSPGSRKDERTDDK